MTHQTNKEVHIFQKPRLKSVVVLVGIAGLVYLLSLLLSAAYGFLAFSIGQKPPASLWSAVGHFLGMTAADQQAVYGWRFAISLLALLAWVALVLATIDSIKKSGPTGRYRAALVATVPFAPGIAAFTTTVAYVTPVPLPQPLGQWVTSLAVIVGALVGLLVWLLAALLYRRSASPDGMNSRTYGELRQRLSQLDARLAALRPLIPAEPATQPGATSTESADATMLRTYYTDACLHRDAIAHELGLSLYGSELLKNNPVSLNVGLEMQREPVEGLHWIMGTGYMNLWYRLHRAEEALIQLNPLSEVISDAVYDDMRLYKSNMRNCESMRRNLRTAVTALDRSARELLVMPCEPSPPLAPPAASAAPTNGVATAEGLAGTKQPGSRANKPARPPVSGRRRATMALSAILSTFIISPILSLKAAPAGTSKTALPPGQANGTGAGAPTGAPPSPAPISEQQARGILREIRCSINTFRDSRWDALIQARNRCMRTGLLTSLAAYVLLCLAIIMGAPTRSIVAVTAFYLVGALVGLFSRLREDSQTDRAVEDYGLATVRLIFTPLFCGLAAVGGVVLINLLPAVQAQSTDSATAQRATIDLLAIFSLEHNQIGLIVAAVFGLTPRLLIDRLLQTTDQYKVDLQNTEGGKATNAPASGATGNSPATTGGS